MPKQRKFKEPHKTTDTRRDMLKIFLKKPLNIQIFKKYLKAVKKKKIGKKEKETNFDRQIFCVKILLNIKMEIFLFTTSLAVCSIYPMPQNND